MKKQLETIKQLKLHEYSMSKMMQSLSIVNMVLYLDAYKALREAINVNDVIHASMILDSLKGGMI